MIRVVGAAQVVNVSKRLAEKSKAVEIINSLDIDGHAELVYSEVAGGVNEKGKIGTRTALFLMIVYKGDVIYNDSVTLSDKVSLLERNNLMVTSVTVEKLNDLVYEDALEAVKALDKAFMADMFHKWVKKETRMDLDTFLDQKITKKSPPPFNPKQDQLRESIWTTYVNDRAYCNGFK